MTRLIGCDLYDVRSAQVERDRLLAEALAHFDLDGVHKRAAAPVIVARRECQFLARIPAIDGKRPAAGELSAAAFGDAVARQRQYCGKIGSRCITFHHDCISRSENFPVRICCAQRSRHGIRTQRRSIVKRNPAPDAELPALIARIGPPRSRQCGLSLAARVQRNQRIEYQT